MHADVVFRGGRIFPGRADQVAPEAVAITGGRITQVGTWADVRDDVGSRTRVVELSGRTLLPGFQDAHTHPPAAGLIDKQCNLYQAETVAACLAAIDAFATLHPEDPWIVGGGWPWEAFAPRGPAATVLDPLVGDRPAFLESRDGHAAWVSSGALRVAGITPDTADPPGGRIDRDETGRPTGLLHESAVDLVEVLLPPLAAATWEEAILTAQADLHRLGITAWQDAGVYSDTHAAYRTLDLSGRLTARVTGALRWDEARDLTQLADLQALRWTGDPIQRYRATAVKLFQDGIMENFTAALGATYRDSTGGPTDRCGSSLFEPEALGSIATALDAAGFDVHVHAIGDRAVRESLDALAAARLANGPRDARHQLAHVEFVSPADCHRFAELGVFANIQALWACPHASIDELTIPFVDATRATWLYPFGSLWRAGAPLAMGSDWSVSTADPLLQIEVAVTRIDPDLRAGPALLPDERLPLSVALEAFTLGSARANRLDDRTGTLEAGKAADLVVLDRDILASDPGPIGDARVLLTLVDGAAVYADPGLGW